MTTLNELHAAELVRELSESSADPRIDLVVATASLGDLQLTLVVDGQTKTFKILRSAAASAIGRIAEALSKSP